MCVMYVYYTRISGRNHKPQVTTIQKTEAMRAAEGIKDRIDIVANCLQTQTRQHC